jgi:hypothetical protein
MDKMRGSCKCIFIILPSFNSQKANKDFEGLRINIYSKQEGNRFARVNDRLISSCKKHEIGMLLCKGSLRFLY